MIILGSNTEVLRARLAAAPATTQPTFSFAWGDDATAPALGNTRGALNGTTNVNLVAAPATGAKRVVKSGFIYNGDTAAVTLTLEHYDGSAPQQIAKVALAAGYTLHFGPDGLRVTDANGALSSTSSGSGGSSGSYDWIVALGDETTTMTTGTAKVTIRAPRAMTLTKVKASLSTASTSGAPQFDVKKNGVSIFSTKPTINATEKTSETATPSVLSTTAIGADDELTFDIVTAGTGAKGPKVTLVGTSP